MTRQDDHGTKIGRPPAPPPPGPRLARLETRLARVERTNRTLWTSLALVLAGLLLAATQTPPDVLRVRGLELLDEDDRVRARLGLEGGHPGLHLMDGEGVRRISLGQSDDGVALYLSDEAGDTRVGAAHFAHGGSGYALHGPGGEGALVLYLKEQGTLTHYDADGSVLARFPVP